MNFDASKSAGALLGAQIAGLICAALQYFWHIPISTETASEITGITVFLLSHLLPSPLGPKASS